MIKEMYSTINAALVGDTMSIATAEALLRSLAKLTGKDYCIIHLRVCYKENGKFYDAWANA